MWQLGLLPTQLAGMAHRDHLRAVDDDVASIFGPAVGRSRCSNSVDRTNDLLLRCVPLEVGPVQARLVEMLGQGRSSTHSFRSDDRELIGCKNRFMPRQQNLWASFGSGSLPST